MSDSQHSFSLDPLDPASTPANSPDVPPTDAVERGIEHAVFDLPEPVHFTDLSGLDEQNILELDSQPGEPMPLGTEAVEPDAVPEPALVAAAPAAMPVFRPVYTVEPAATKRGITLDDDPHIDVTLPEKHPPRWRQWAAESFMLGRDFFFAAIIALFVVFYIVRPVKVEGTSMLPRLEDGQRIFINEFVYTFNPIERGDIVVFWYPKNPKKSFIKRVIGLPGDEVQLINGKLRINGVDVPEAYLSKDYTTIPGPTHTWRVEPHHYFVMGDNRDASNDSRSWGLVPEKYIYGKAVYRYWPLSEAGSLVDQVEIQEFKKLTTPEPEPDDE